MIELEVVAIGEVVPESDDTGTERGIQCRVAECGEHRRRVSARPRLASRAVTIVDVAGVAIAVSTSDDARRVAVADALAGFPETDDRPVASITVDAARATVPDVPPRAEELGFRFWAVDDGVVASASSAVLRVVGDGAAIHVDDDDDLDVVEGLVAIALAWLLAPRARYLVHGAAIARDGVGFLVLGESRAGKSTLAAGALEAGWAVLSDDLVVLAPQGDGIRLFGVHRDPAIPMELGGPAVERGTPLDGPRQRALLDRAVLTSGAVALAGTILVAHADDASGTLTPASARRIIPLLLKSFAPTVDDSLRPTFFAFTERVAALPAWELGHAADVTRRRAHVARALTQCAP